MVNPDVRKSPMLPIVCKTLDRKIVEHIVHLHKYTLPNTYSEQT